MPRHRIGGENALGLLADPQMSGGSFNYLFTKSPEDLIRAETTIRAMADALDELGYAEDAAAETRRVLMLVAAYRRAMIRKLRRLEGVWQAVEYYRSGDWTEQEVLEALEAYRTRPRGGTTHAPTKRTTDGGA